MKPLHRFVYAAVIAVFLTGCGGSSPLKKLMRELDQYPEYSIILEDMKVEGNFFSDYYHKYKVIHAEKTAGDSLTYVTETTDWLKVSEDEFSDKQRYLGMALASKSLNGEASDIPEPPAYRYVGDERYGNWRTDNSGNRFWEFYGKYAFLHALIGGFNRPIYYNDWDTYRGYRQRRQPYFGSNRQYGTFGSATKKTNPTFFQRRQTMERAKKQSFANKLRQRTRRSNMSRSRGRSGGFGK